GYRQFLYDHVREILQLMPVDGFFFDIVGPRPSLARHWLDAMDNAGLNPEDERDRYRFAVKVIQDWEREMTEFVRQFNRDCTIFYNSGHVGPRHRASCEAYTHYELESLASGGWGYMHFPQTVRYARRLGKECLGMTGKFHTTWGDFGSFKNPAALQFECFRMLALGAKCAVGDQLHPSGRIDRHTYALIGSVYAEVEKKEPWCREVEPVVEIGVLTPEEFAKADERNQPAAVGAVRVFQELRCQFDVIDSQCDFSPYKVLVLPDAIPVDEGLAQKLESFLRGGGAVIASYRSGLRPDGTGFATAALGVQLKGEAPYSPDFIVPGDALAAGVRATGNVMYRRGLEVEALPGSEVLAQVEVPYFNRTWRHFCSHGHTPSSGKVGYPGVVRRGNAIYFMHPVFSQYQENAPHWCKQLVANALSLVLPQRVVEVEGPSTLM
ncbi:MAG: beta-galactosidase trimerization domain-containing protein, partial [Armatimonadota bacterium]|nr:beta-galactosidase trimerization domain-containing protein [Armatimonadota bacterium]